MDKSHVISALFRKYCHLMGQAKRHPDRADEYQADMMHVEATIRLFRADADLDSLKPIKPRKDTRWSKRGYGVRTTIEILKQADRPLSTREIAEEVMRREGLSPDDKESRADVCSSLHMSILRRVGKDIVRVEGKPMRWAVL
ncbi:MAG: HTH domain-containing protein [Sphingorhabdus sp.]|uniref:HTH domain-containing protein n=1 Tax=Sphingorhabdus sp. TaxID=1902408 RepID=UPI003C81ED35